MAHLKKISDWFDMKEVFRKLDDNDLKVVVAIPSISSHFNRSRPQVVGSHQTSEKSEILALFRKAPFTSDLKIFFFKKGRGPKKIQIAEFFRVSWSLIKILRCVGTDWNRHERGFGSKMRKLLEMWVSGAINFTLIMVGAFLPQKILLSLYSFFSIQVVEWEKA